MKKIILQYLLSTFCFSLTVLGQPETYVKEVKWEKYKDSTAGVSFLSPKLPVALDMSDACRQLESKTYYSYADGAIYSVVVNSKSKKPRPTNCYYSSDFDRSYFEERVKTLTANPSDIEVNNIKIKNKPALKFTKAAASYWIIDDLTNERWIEISVTARPDTVSEAEKLINSIDVGNNLQAIEIGEGAERMFGDDLRDKGQTESNKSLNPSADTQNDTILLVQKPRAKYTDAARQSQTQGSITLRVVFLANGGIGNITPLTELPNGLTEEAIKAAKKISFLPFRKNKTPLNLTKQVQYNFSLF